MSDPGEFSLELEVRDYECDAIGIVNNAVYFNYLEHARHEFLKKHVGVNFTELASRNVNLVIVETEARYRSPLRPGDKFEIKTKMETQVGSKFRFIQSIYRLSDGKKCFEATLVGAAMDEKGRPMDSGRLIEAVPELGFLNHDQGDAG